LAELANSNAAVREAIRSAEQNIEGAREELIGAAELALDFILSEQDELLYMPVPIPFVAAIDLLYRVSVGRSRLWARAQTLSNSLIGQSFRLVDGASASVFSVERPPVAAEAASTIRPLVDFVRENVALFSEDTRAPGQFPPAASAQTVAQAITTIQSVVGAYAL